MYSHEIERLMKIKNYIINYSDYFEILNTSPQINFVKYNYNDDTFNIKTKDNYDFNFKIKSKTR